MTDWNEIERVFHTLWGQASSGQYDKSTWNQMQALLYEARRAQPAPAPLKKPRKKTVPDA